ncbi:hypothetical protein LIER_06037 [Lithospermum erythrorhizon]|uniref:Uncharacterized protein n=1 Tax=Lithospermum erythrorhizon TaxID=34254 RepID=A0AAV3P419_LITER
MPNKSKPRSPRHSPEASVGFMPIGSEEGYKSDHPYFVDAPYILPSGVKVTDDSVSRPIHFLATDMLKNCMLRAEVLRAMKVQSPTRLHKKFPHYQLRATETAYAMSLQWAESERVAREFELVKSSVGEEMRKVREERDLALAEKDKITRKYETLLQSQEELEVVKADSQKMASDLEKSRDDMSRVQSHLDGSMRADYFSDLGDDYVVYLFNNIPNDEDEDLGADDDEENEGDEDGDGEDDAE